MNEPAAGSPVADNGNIRDMIRRRLAEAKAEGWDQRSQIYLAAAAVVRAIPTMSRHDALVLVNMVRDGYFRRSGKPRPRPE